MTIERYEDIFPAARVLPRVNRQQEVTVIEAMASSSELTGLRVLVVEDEAAISLLLEDMLLDFGCEVIGPAARLAGEPIYPVAEALAERSIPFVFSTGYGSAGIRDAYRNRPVLQKPFAQNDLKQKLLMARATV
jgi:hypothetical protein